MHARGAITTESTMRFIELPDHEQQPWLELADLDAALAARAASHVSDAALALRLSSDLDDAALEALAPALPFIRVLSLSFPRWVDGRGYSVAWLLRRRYGYAGELRATGEVLVDMVPLLQRCGFDAAVLRADQSREAAERSLGFFSHHYQGDVPHPLPRYRQGGAPPPHEAVVSP